MNKPYYKKWCTAHVVMKFKKLKDCARTESGKRMIEPGQKFMPLNNDLQFTFLGFSDPLFTIDDEKGGEE